MMLSLHKNATTTPAIRAKIAASGEPASVLAERYSVTLDTIYRWRGRTSFEDRSHTAHQLATTLTPAQEAVVVELRRMLLLPLDDLLAVAREFLNPDVSRSGLDRCLRRHRVSNLNALRPKTPAEPHKAFKSYEPGFLHVDVKYLPQMADETTRRYLFVAIDRATRWVFVRIMPAKTAANARRFLRDLHRACPIRIAKILTDNGKEFTDRLFASRSRAPSGEHEFDLLCTELGIEHRLTPPKSPQTNGMVERFNGRISDVLKTNRFDSALDLEQTLMRYVHLYNTQLPQSALGSRTPMKTMKDWHQSHPQLFVKSPRNHAGRDNYLAVIQRKPGALRNGAPFTELPPAFRQLQDLMLRKPGGDREMVDILALVLHHDEQAVLAAVEIALAEGVATKTHVLNLLHRLVDGKVTGGPDIDAPRALILRLEPKANVERYDGLRAQTAGGRHAS